MHEDSRSGSSHSLSSSSSSSGSDAHEDNSATPSRAPHHRYNSAPVPTASNRRHRRRTRRHASTNPAQGLSSGMSNSDHADNSIDDRNPLNIALPTPGRRGSSRLYAQANLSGTSIESSTLLDHRAQQGMTRPRRQSLSGSVAGHGSYFPESFRRTSTAMPHSSMRWSQSLADEALDENRTMESGGDSDGEDTPFLPRPATTERSSLLGGKKKSSRPSTTESTRQRIPTLNVQPASPAVGVRDYGSLNINFPPSVPGSPRSRSPLRHNEFVAEPEETIIHIEDDPARPIYPPSSPPTPPREAITGLNAMMRAEEDVCFPIDDGMSDEEVETLHGGHVGRPRMRNWPDLAVLEEWSREEKEQRSEGIRAKKLPEPVLVGGRLRPPVKSPWHKDEEEAPYRYTYFNEELDSTIHAHTISELLTPGQSFRELFKPDPKILEDDSEDEMPPEDMPGTRTESLASEHVSPNGAPSERTPSPPRIGPRPTFWLDVLCPTEAEMKIITKAFNIHPLTAEDIMQQEAREKVELFRDYYLVSYRTFEQDPRSEDYMEPVNFYVVVFREGIISFHFAMTPHSANVRRRVRQLKDYITVSADWLSYALIDSITDAFAPLIQKLENEVDDIDDAILQMHLSPGETATSSASKEARTRSDSIDPSEPVEEEQKSDGEMLKRVGDARRSVMGLFRLMGNKADVIKGFAKRCNENWAVAPRSEIGLYLGDIQDHIITMVSNLNHMEKILSRSHANYLAQINIKMNERQEQTADVLGRLTVLGTIVLPMNIVTGLWGMNVLVPFQDVPNLIAFWCITVGLLIFGFMCYFIAKRVYKIV